MEIYRILGANCKGNYPERHPMIRIPEGAREQILITLDLVLRSDRAGMHVINTFLLNVTSITT